MLTQTVSPELVYPRQPSVHLASGLMLQIQAVCFVKLI